MKGYLSDGGRDMAFGVVVALAGRSEWYGQANGTRAAARCDVGRRKNSSPRRTPTKSFGGDEIRKGLHAAISIPLLRVDHSLLDGFNPPYVMPRNFSLLNTSES
jgi:hypothetical protein